MKSTIVNRYGVNLGVILLGTMLTAGLCEEPDKPIEADVTKDNLCSEIAKITCHNAFQCCTGEALEEVFGIKQTTSESDCRKDVELTCESENSAFLWSLSKGSVSLTKKNIDACFNQYIAPEDTCAPVVTEFAPACFKSLYSGARKEGGACLFDFECPTDTYCGPNRECAAFSKEGDPCSLSVSDSSDARLMCAEGLYCLDDPGDEDYETCVKRSGEDKPCNRDVECQESLICLLEDAPVEDGFLGTCVTKKELDKSCQADYECASGLCLPSVCEDSNQACYTDRDCGGTCNETEASCLDDDDCPGDGERCVLTECEDGGRCDEDYTVLAYCDAMLIDRFGGEDTEVESRGPCRETDFYCGANQCVSSHDICDGSQDCADGRDEMAGLCVCGEGEFQCANNDCIDESGRCDGFTDCSDGSDESSAECGSEGCDSDEFECDDGACIPESYVCDTLIHCSDGSDEDVDLCGSGVCGDYGWECDDGTCISIYGYCDSFYDCPDYSDEANCN